MTEPFQNGVKFGWLLTGELIVLLGLLGYWWTQPKASPAPNVQWNIGGRTDAVDAYEPVKAQEPLQLTVELEHESYIYIVSYDSNRGSIAMFPSAYLRSSLSSNPLPPGRHQFPGTHQELELKWHTGDAKGPVAFMVITSDHRLNSLEQNLARFRQMGNAAFPTKDVLGSYAPTGGMEAVPPPGRLHDTTLRAAFETLDAPGQSGDMVPLEGVEGAHVGVLRLHVDAEMATEDVEEQIREALGDKLRDAIHVRPDSASAPR